MNRCKKGSRRCSVTKRCVSTTKSRLAYTKRCKPGSRKCANGRCYGKTKKPKYQLILKKTAELFKK